jgi:hypothetical protein
MGQNLRDRHNERRSRRYDRSVSSSSRCGPKKPPRAQRTGVAWVAASPRPSRLTVRQRPAPGNSLPFALRLRANTRAKLEPRPRAT